MKNLHELLRRFAEADIDYVVVGGYAGVLHGSSYVTNDLDLCVALTPETIRKLRAALVDLHPVHRLTHQRLSFLEHPPADQEVKNLYLETDGGIVDLLGEILGLGDFATLRPRAMEITLFGGKCAVLTLDDLIKSKETLGRERDLLAAKELRAIAAKRRQQP